MLYGLSSLAPAFVVFLDSRTRLYLHLLGAYLNTSVHDPSGVLKCPLSRASVIGLYTSYATPIFLRITSGRNKLVPGPFSLGKWYLPVGIVAVSWVAFIIILLLFPGGSNPSAADMSECRPLFSPRSSDSLSFFRLCRGPGRICLHLRVDFVDYIGP